MHYEINLTTPEDYENIGFHINFIEENLYEITSLKINFTFDNFMERLLENCSEIPYLETLVLSRMGDGLQDEIKSVLENPSILSLTCIGIDFGFKSNARIAKLSGPVNLSDFPFVRDLTTDGIVTINEGHKYIKKLKASEIRIGSQNIDLKALHEIESKEPINVLPRMYDHLRVFNAPSDSFILHYFENLEEYTVYSSQINEITDLENLKNLTIIVDKKIKYNPILNDLEMLIIDGSNKKLTDEDCQIINEYQCYRIVKNFRSFFITDEKTDNIEIQNISCWGQLQKNKNVQITVGEIKKIKLNREIYAKARINGNVICVLSDNIVYLFDESPFMFIEDIAIDNIEFIGNFKPDPSFFNCDIRNINLNNFEGVTMRQSKFRKLHINRHSEIKALLLDGIFSPGSFELIGIPRYLTRLIIESTNTNDDTIGKIEIMQIPRPIKHLQITGKGLDLQVNIKSLHDGIEHFEIQNAKGIIELKYIPESLVVFKIISSPDLQSRLPDDDRIEIIG